jgi:hypothetical protein
MKVYVVNIIHYEDDYKHRYDSGVYPEEPKIFKSKQEAEKYVSSEIFDTINEDLECMGKSKLEGYAEYFKKDKSSLLTKYKYDFETMKDLHEHFCQGEFVDKTMEWSITERELN